MKEIQFLDSFGTFGIYNRKNKDDEKQLVTVCTWEKINGSHKRHYNIMTRYRKIPKISPSMYKLPQIQDPQTGNAKNPSLNHPSKYKPPEGLYLENCPEIKSKTKLKQYIYFQL